MPTLEQLIAEDWVRRRIEEEERRRQEEANGDGDGGILGTFNRFIQKIPGVSATQEAAAPVAEQMQRDAETRRQIEGELTEPVPLYEDGRASLRQRALVTPGSYVQSSIGGLTGLAGTGLEKLGAEDVGGTVREKGEEFAAGGREMRERLGAPETTTEKAIDIGSQILAEGSLAAATGLPGLISRGGTALGLRYAPKAVPFLRGLGAGTGGAPVAGAIEAGMTPEESLLGAVSPEAAEDPAKRFATGAGASILFGPAAEALLAAGKPLVKGARGFGRGLRTGPPAAATPSARPLTRSADEQLGSTAELAARTRDFARQDPDRWDRFMKWVRSLRLWNPLARVRDLVENPVMGMTEAVKDIPAWMGDVTIEQLDRLAGGRYGGRAGRVEGGPTAVGAGEGVRAVGRGFRQLGREFRGEQKYILPERGTRYLETVGAPKSPSEMNALEKFQTLSFKMAQAADAVGRPPAEARVARNMARAQGIREGLKGQALEDRTLELMAKPTDEMLDEMGRQADLATFMADEPIATWLREGVLSGKVGRLLQPFLPFTRSSSNVATRVLDYSPAGLVRAGREMDRLEKLIRNSRNLAPAERELLQRVQRRRVTQQFGRGVTGTGVGVLGWALADRINTFYPGGSIGSGPRERRRRQQANEPHAAIRIANRWVPLERGLGPLGVQLLIWKQLRELARDDEPEPRTVEEHEGQMRRAIAKYGPELVEFVKKTGIEPALAVAQAMYEVSPLPELEALFSAAGSGPEDPFEAGRLARRQTTGLVPSISTVAARGTDPIQRDVTNPAGALANVTPGASQLLPERVDPLGEPVRRKGSGWGALDPFRTEPVETDPLRVELGRVDYVVPTLDQEPGEPDAAYRARQRDTGQRTRRRLEYVIQSDAYRAIPERTLARVRAKNPGATDAEVRQHAERRAREEQQEMLRDEVSALRRWVTNRRKKTAGR